MRVDCWDCKSKGRCHIESRHHRGVLFALGRGLPSPSCPEYRQRFYHGIDGVPVTTNPPRPLWPVAAKNKSSTRISSHDARP